MYYTIGPLVLQYYKHDGTPMYIEGGTPPRDPHVYRGGDPPDPMCTPKHQLASEYFTLKHADNVTLLGICIVYLTNVSRFIG